MASMATYISSIQLHEIHIEHLNYRVDIFTSGEFGISVDVE